MSEMGEVFQCMREASQEKRANNRECSAQILANSGIEFEEKNFGAHLIVTATQSLKVDFWPGTGKWISRCGKKGRGVFNLKRFIGSKKAEAERKEK